MKVSRTLPVVIAAHALAILSGPASAQSQLQRLTPTGPLTSDIFSYDVGFNGTVAVMGAPFATYSGVSQPGRAFLFEFNGAAWTQTAKLIPPVLQSGANFGTEVAAGMGTSGDIIAIGAAAEDGAFENSGAVYIYEKVGSVWTLTQKLTPSTPEFHGNFGVGLSISDGVVAVGSNGATVDGWQYAGTVFLYEKIASVWALSATLVPPDPEFAGTFGTQVAIDHGRLLVASPQKDVTDQADAGAAYVFERAGTDWSFVQELLAPTPVASEQFASAVAVHGSVAVVGAHLAALPVGDKAGRVDVYRLTGADWAHDAALTAPVTHAGDHFGVDVAIDGREILVGSYLEPVAGRTGVAHIYRGSGEAWNYSTSLTASDTGGTLLGWRLGLSGDTAVIGGPFYQTNRGAAYVFGSMRACSADLDGTGFVDTDDFDAFVVAYEAGSPAADMDGTGFVDTDDFDRFVHAYEAGC